MSACLRVRWEKLGNREFLTFRVMCYGVWCMQRANTICAYSDITETLQYVRTSVASVSRGDLACSFVFSSLVVDVFFLRFYFVALMQEG